MLNSLISFVQDFFPDTLKKGDYFVERKATFTIYSLIFVEGRFLRSRPYALHITGAKRKLSGTRLLIVRKFFLLSFS